MFCQDAVINGALAGDKDEDALVTTEGDMASLADDARFLGECIQVFYGPTHTTQLHRMMLHLAEELLGRGSVWEGDTI